jgi:hypothetical protein
VLSVFLLLTGALTVFSARQQATALEGNSLYSPGAVRVDADAREVLRERNRFGSDLRVFHSLSEGDRVRSVIVGDPDAFSFPVYEGRSFSRGDGAVVLIGGAVKTALRDGRKVVDIDGRAFEVVGRLGVHRDSLVANDVLVSTGSAGPPGIGGSVVVDGDGVREAAIAAFGAARVSSIDGGANRRTNVDFVSPLLHTFGICLATIGIVSAGVVVALVDRPRRSLLHVLGRSTRRTHALAAARHLALLSSVALVVASICLRSAPPTALPHDLLRSLGALVLIGLTAYVMAAIQLNLPRRRRSWR